MDKQQPISADVIKQVLESGEVPIEINGVHLVVMSLDARQSLHRVVFDDSEWSAEEMNAVMAKRLNDPEGWGHPDMDEYDKAYGHLFKDSNGNNS